jgi:integrase
MGRQRKPITPVMEGQLWVARVRHPVLNRIVRFSLGDGNQMQGNLDALNEIFLNEHNWYNPPKKTPEFILKQWRSEVVKLKGPEVSKGSKKVKGDAAELARIVSERDAYKLKVDELLAVIHGLKKEVEHWRGKKLHRGPRPTLKDACDKWFESWKGRRDGDHVKNVKYDLDKFVANFGAKGESIDSVEGRESDIDAWLKGLKVPVEKDEKGNIVKWRPVSASRLRHVRLYVVKMLTENGVILNRKQIVRVSKDEIRKERGRIRWLTKPQAELLTRKLTAPWADIFRVQVAIGLRPEECITLQADNFNEDFSKLTLAPLGHLTLKTGTRTIPVPMELRPLLQLRARQGNVIFPEPETSESWRSGRRFSRRFNYALVKAAKAAGIKTKMDCRIGRRTCASLLLQANVSAEKIAALLGNSPSMILDHYGDPDIEQMGGTLSRATALA